MPETLRIQSEKSTTVRANIRLQHRSVGGRAVHDEPRAKPLRENRAGLAVRPTVVPTQAVSTDSFARRFENFVAAIFATIVAGYAVAVFIRVFAAYGA